MYRTLLFQSSTIESGLLFPKTTSLWGSVSSRSTFWSFSRSRFACGVTLSLSRSLFASSSMSSHGKTLPILVSVHSCFNCQSLSPPRNSRSRFASPWVVMTPTRCSNHSLLLRFAAGTLNVSHCFRRDVCCFQKEQRRPCSSLFVVREQ